MAIELMDKCVNPLVLSNHFDNAYDIREISWAWGPEVTDRNYRITVGTPGNFHVSDWHVGFNADFTEIEFSDLYQRIM